jgi:hypothetical protein
VGRFRPTKDRGDLDAGHRSCAPRRCGVQPELCPELPRGAVLSGSLLFRWRSVRDGRGERRESLCTELCDEFRVSGRQPVLHATHWQLPTGRRLSERVRARLRWRLASLPLRRSLGVRHCVLCPDPRSGRRPRGLLDLQAGRWSAVRLLCRGGVQRRWKLLRQRLTGQRLLFLFVRRGFRLYRRPLRRTELHPCIVRGSILLRELGLAQKNGPEGG